MQVDLRSLDASHRLAAVVPLFEQLARGEGITIVSDTSEIQVLEFMQKERAGEFDWFQLESGPGRWLLVLARRPAGSSRRRQVLEFMEADHRQIHALLAELCGVVKRREPAGTIAEAATHLRTSLERHMRIEEDLLLPLVAERLGSPRGPAAVLRDEHLQIAALVQTIAEGASSDAAAPCEALTTLLVHHSGMEERILYAVTDLLLTEPERDELVRRCQRI
jgi:uncharacterized protein (DUF2249 family)